MSAPATLVLDSGNGKIADRKRGQRVAATYASIRSTCPTSCPLRGEGCYAQMGHVAITVARLDAAGATADEAARYEADLIVAAALQGRARGRALRIHVSGDATTYAAASSLGRAVATWRALGGGRAWSYTRAWRDVSRYAWGVAVSVLASVESEEDGARALAAGYAPALVVAEHSSARAEVRGGVRWIPCPAQTRENTTCADCRLCWDADALRKRGAGITFAAHGSGRKRALTVIQ